MTKHSIILRTMLLSIALVGVLSTGRARAEVDDPLGELTIAAQKTCTSTASWSNVSCQLEKVLERCREGDGDACVVGASFNLSQPLHDVPVGAVARSLLMRGCAADAIACVSAAHVVMSRLVDTELATSFLRMGCERDASVCKAAAWLFIRGTEMPRDFDAARRFMSAGCSRGDASACAVARELAAGRL